MGRRKNTAANVFNEPSPGDDLYDDDEVLEPGEPRTRQVEVNSVTRRRYIEEEPLQTQLIEDTVPAPADPFAMFSEVLTADQTARIRLWFLPFYEIDGKASARNPEGRRYLATIDYDPARPDLVLEQVRARLPQGGTVQLELTVDGKLHKRGLLQVMPTPLSINSVNTGNPAPASPTVQVVSPGTDPLAMMRSQIDFAKEFINVAKDLMPQPAAPAAAPAVERPLNDRLLETLVVKAFEADKVPADRFTEVLTALSGGKQEPGLIQTALETIGPHLGTFLTQIGSGVNAWLLRVASGGAAAPVTATLQPTAASSPAAAAEPGQLAPDPAQHAYMRTVNRLVDDMLEHVACVNRGALGIDPYSAAESVADLLNRFPQHEVILSTVRAMLAVDTTPEQVIELCSMLFVESPAYPYLIEAKSNNAAREWVGALQIAAREILAGEENADERPIENESEPAHAEA